MDKLNVSVLFKNEQETVLHHIFSKQLATKDQSDSLLKYRDYGTTDLETISNAFYLNPKIW